MVILYLIIFVVAVWVEWYIAKQFSEVAKNKKIEMEGSLWASTL